MKRKDFQCLLVETKDHRKFFTHEKNYPLLIEFSKTFGADISVVHVQEAEVLTLQALAPAICNPANAGNTSDFQLLEFKIKATSRDKMRLHAAKIRNFIRTWFESGRVVELDKVAKKFSKLVLTRACFCNHISFVRKEFESRGRTVEKIGGGKYRLN